MKVLSYICDCKYFYFLLIYRFNLVNVGTLSGNGKPTRKGRVKLSFFGTTTYKIKIRKVTMLRGTELGKIEYSKSRVV
jgi:hypothetical protein